MGTEIKNLKDVEIKGTMIEEQETVIQWYHDDDTMRIYTCEPSFLTKLKGMLDGKEYTIERLTERSVQVRCKKSDVSLYKVSKKNLSEEQREILRERAKKMHGLK